MSSYDDDDDDSSEHGISDSDIESLTFKEMYECEVDKQHECKDCQGDCWCDGKELNCEGCDECQNGNYNDNSEDDN